MFSVMTRECGGFSSDHITAATRSLNFRIVSVILPSMALIEAVSASFFTNSRFCVRSLRTWLSV